MHRLGIAAAIVLGTLSLAGATDYTWNGSSGLWTDATRWTPTGGPPAGAADTGAVNSGTAQAGANLGTTGDQPTVRVNGPGKVQLNVNTSGHTFVLDGGKISMNNPGRFGTRTMTDTVSIQNTGSIRGQRRHQPVLRQRTDPGWHVPRQGTDHEPGAHRRWGVHGRL